MVFAGMDSCYDDAGRAQRCMPEFENAAFNKSVMVTNTCGSPAERYCLQTGVTGMAALCHQCDSGDPALHHNATYLTDFHNTEEPTWWQSQSMVFGIQYPNSVNLTLHLGKAYEITYVRLKFFTSRPESFAIYKRTRINGPWIPYQFYSASCHKSYGRRERDYLRPGDSEQVAFCTDEFSDISPLMGGNVAFSTLEGRPSAYNFDGSPSLQEWVTATDILISLNRLNTFGDDIFKDQKVLQSYYYAISDFSVGGRCKCNGHASECVINEVGRLVCNCQHNTTGVDCEKCWPSYHDRPWARATAQATNECLPCNCNGRSEACIFDAELYRSTGHGGHCLNCRGDTDGPRCERCRQNFYRSDPQYDCRPCGCDPAGSLSLQCDGEGTCTCKPSVMGQKCDRCHHGYHSLTEAGCSPCACDPAGSIGICNSENGQCTCKENVEGHLCHRYCRKEYYSSRQPHTPAGCTSCFCYGHSAACFAAMHYAVHHIRSNFTRDTDGWRGQYLDGREFSLQWMEGELHLPMNNEEWVYFIAPVKFLGNQLLSYRQNLTITFRVENKEFFPLSLQLLLEGPGRRASILLSLQTEREKGDGEWTFTFRLHESEAGLQTPLTAFQFHQLLSNLTAIRITAIGGPQYTVSLREVALVSARPGLSPPAYWVEECVCPQGYISQFCEICSPGYKRETPSGGPFVPCVPCTCNQHGTCNPETGMCQCLHNTAGPMCELCADGFYGNSFVGRTDDCKPCPCPGQSACALVPNSTEVVCTECPTGQTGRRCELCDNGFYGDPLGWDGPARPCTLCQCNGNTRQSADCDHRTGMCRDCIYNTAGDHCDMCKEGYYGNALALNPLHKCNPCSCSLTGSARQQQTCHSETGQCECLPNVIGQQCNQCKPGFFNLVPVYGCERCDCHPIGSENSFCHPIMGQCPCHPGVEGMACDKCQPGFFSFSSKGCRACSCSLLGSLSLQCQEDGTCVCKKGFVGSKCDQCEVNYYHSATTSTCEECPVCYSLVRDQVTADKLKAKLWVMEELLKKPRYQNYRDHKSNSSQRDQPHSDRILEAPTLLDIRDIFLDQILELEASTQTVLSQLRNFSGFWSCENSANGKLCSLLSDSIFSFRQTRKELHAARSTLSTMNVIPEEISSKPTKWNSLVNESQALANSQGEAAAQIELIARNALLASNISYTLLSNILEEESSREFVEELEEQFQQMQEAKESLSHKIDETVTKAKKSYKSSERSMTVLATALSNLTNSQEKMLPVANLSGEVEASEKLLRSKAELLEESMERLRPELETAKKGMEAQQEAEKLMTCANVSYDVATSSVATAKETAAEAKALLKALQGTQRSFVQREPQTKAALEKVGAIQGKQIAYTLKKTQQAEKMLGAAANLTSWKRTATGANRAADKTSKEVKEILGEAKNAHKMASNLNQDVSSALEEMMTQSVKAEELKREIEELDEHIQTPGVGASADIDKMDKKIRKARISLESDVKKLSKLLKRLAQLNGGAESALNETEAQLEVLRQNLHKASLEKKMRALQEAAEQQQSKMREFAKEIAEIEVDKHNLEDVIQSLPQGCFNRLGSTKN
uniref:Laminin subunit gamma 3 n=1 Tax=Latimeria chalumnae TaxID=7897 RepID=H3BA71_LATCH